ncbi:MAG: hypothetical protein K2N60_09820 [Oscillospiraceae bacterium]|nr:hypothetical protein [Oscillospiraceae bacterium]
MKKRLIVMALSACLLAGCSAEDTANAGDNVNGGTAAVTAESMTEITENAAETTGTTETTEASAETTDETKAETSENEVTTGTNPLDTAAAFVVGGSPEPDEEALKEAAERPEVTAYELNYAETEFVSEEQSALAEFLYKNRSDDQLRSNIEQSRVNILAAEPDIELWDYEVVNHEFCADFDGDGNSELFVYRSVNLDERSNWACWRDLWYTDGETAGMLYYGIGRTDIAGVFEAQNGVPLMYIVPDILMGSSIQTAYCVSAEDGSADWYELPEDRCFMYTSAYKDGNEKKFLLIYDTDFGYDDFNLAMGAHDYDNFENFQQIGWLDGELEILSGYGAE